MANRSSAGSHVTLLLAATLLGGVPGAALAQEATHHVGSTPANVVWGWFPVDRAPVLTIASGDTVDIDTLTHAGSIQAADPERYLGTFGVAPHEVLQDVLEFWESKSDRPREGRSAHVITGPIYIEGAEPGDMLEVQILDLATRVPYGINTTGATSGVFGPRIPARRSTMCRWISRGCSTSSEPPWSMDGRSRFSRKTSTCRWRRSWG